MHSFASAAWSKPGRLIASAVLCLGWKRSSATLIYSVRRLVQHPAITAIAVLSIGLGLGANGTIFSMVSRFVCVPRRSAIRRPC